jgi:hypothetical protein
MTPLRSSAMPIYPGYLSLISGAKPRFGTSPFKSNLRGLGGCGCGPVGGCGCSSPGLSGLGQSPTLDSIISNTMSWLGGVAQSQLPASAALPPNYGSAGAALTSLSQYLPYIIGGYLVYRLLK